jgi:hypothetical protein
MLMQYMDGACLPEVGLSHVHRELENGWWIRRNIYPILQSLVRTHY